jgi:hypothetical protein
VSLQPTPSGIVVGSITTAATVGALIAIGHRLGSAGIPFAAVSAVMFHRTASAGAVGLVFTGLILHAATIFVWSAIFVWVVRALRWSALVCAMLVAAAALSCSWLVAWSTGGGLSSVLTLGDRVIYGLVLAVALVVGMRFAFLSMQNARFAGQRTQNRHDGDTTAIERAPENHL